MILDYDFKVIYMMDMITSELVHGIDHDQYSLCIIADAGLSSSSGPVRSTAHLCEFSPRSVDGSRRG